MNTDPSDTDTEPTDAPASGPAPEVLSEPEVLAGELLEGDVLDGDASPEEDGVDETIDHPAKVMRIGTMMKQLLEEVRAATLDEPSRDRLREIYDTSVSELGSALSPDLRDELGRLASPFAQGQTPTSSELQIAQAQLVGWLEGLVQGMQAMLFAQQMAAQHQLQSMRGQLGPGQQPGESPMEERPGTYL